MQLKKLQLFFIIAFLTGSFFQLNSTNPVNAITNTDLFNDEPVAISEQSNLALLETMSENLSSYIGGNGSDYGYSVALDSIENIIIAGETKSADFPVLNGFDMTYNGGGDWDGDAFIIKLDSSGVIIWSTYLGGVGADECSSVAIDSDDNIIVTGITESADFSVLNGYDETYNGGTIYGGDAFLAKFNSTGALLWSTFIGGEGDDIGRSVAIDSDDNIIITGDAGSSDFPVLNGYDEIFNSNDAFLMKFDPLGDLIWSTFFGGTKFERGTSVAIDSSDNIVLTGYTTSEDFPVLNAYDETHNGYSDVLLSKFDSSGDLIWSTYLGGDIYDEGQSVALDSQDNIVVTGYSVSNDFPVLNGYNETNDDNGYDIFLTKFSSSGTLLWSTLFGGYHHDNGFSLALDSQDGITITGETKSSDFPILNGYDKTSDGGDDAFLVKFDSSCDLLWSTFLGGSDWEIGASIVHDSNDNIIVTGYTSSEDFHILTDNQETINGEMDVFLYRLNGSALLDEDEDGLATYMEYHYGTDPLLADSDGDSFNDKEEIMAGTDPLDIDDYPDETDDPSDTDPSETDPSEDDASIGSFLMTISSFALLIVGYRKRR